MTASFTCPRCGRTSHNRTDVIEGYCGACHDWTGLDADVAAYHFDPVAEKLWTEHVATETETP